MRTSYGSLLEGVASQLYLRLGALEDQFDKTCPASTGHRRGEKLEQAPPLLGMIRHDLVIVLLGRVRPQARLQCHPHELVLVLGHDFPLSVIYGPTPTAPAHT